MQDHHGPAKETDITAVLVVALVLMVGVLIAKTAGDFTAKSTSTSTRAGFKKSPTDDACKNLKPFDDSNYIASSDYCVSALSSCTIRDNTASKYGKNNLCLATACCRSTDTMFGASALGNERCRRINLDKNSTCVKKSLNCASGKTKLGTTCGILEAGSVSGVNDVNVLQEGECCGVVNPSPTPVPEMGKVTSCGVSKINCLDTFNTTHPDVRLTADDGTMLGVVCSKLKGKPDTEFKCSISLENKRKNNKSETCDGHQYAAPVYYMNNGTSTAYPQNCAISSKVALDTEGGLYKVCETTIYALSQNQTCAQKAAQVNP